jgi:hypothetical protein
MPGAAHFTDIVRDDPFAIRLGVLVNFPEWHLLPPSSATRNNYGSVGPDLAHRSYTQARNQEMQYDQLCSHGSLVPAIENNGRSSWLNVFIDNDLRAHPFVGYLPDSHIFESLFYQSHGPGDRGR